MHQVRAAGLLLVLVIGLAAAQIPMPSEPEDDAHCDTAIHGVTEFGSHETFHHIMNSSWSGNPDFVAHIPIPKIVFKECHPAGVKVRACRGYPEKNVDIKINFPHEIIVTRDVASARQSWQPVMVHMSVYCLGL